MVKICKNVSIVRTMYLQYSLNVKIISVLFHSTDNNNINSNNLN